MVMRVTLRRHLVALGCLAIITAAYTWPLASQLRTAIPGTANDHDVATFVWNVGWVRQALTGDASLWRTDAVLLPTGADLRFHTYGLLQGLMAFPLSGWLGVVGAYNAVHILSLFLNGAAVYLFVDQEVRDWLAALLAAEMVMLATPILFHFRVGRPAFASIWIMVGALMALQRLMDRPGVGSALAVGGLMLAALLTDFQILLYSLLWLALYWLYRLWQSPKTTLGAARLVSLAGAVAIFAIPFWLIFAPAVQAVSEGYPVPKPEGVAFYSFDWRHYFQPAIIPIAYGYDLLLCAVAAALIYRWRGAYRFWLVGALFFLVLALGPYDASSQLSLPFTALHWLPSLRQFRTPARLTIPAVFGLGVVAGYALAALLPRLRPPWLAWLLVALAMIGRLLYAIDHDPLLTQRYPDYAFYHQVAAEPGQFSLLEVPFGVRSGFQRIGSGGEILQYYQHIHGKPLLNGMVARLPIAVFRSYRRNPSLVFLSGEESTAGPEALNWDFASVLEWSKAGYVLVHGNLLASSRREPIVRFLDSQSRLTRVGVEEDLIIYRVK